MSVCEWRAHFQRSLCLAQALARGELSYAKVRALTRVATPETEERLLAVARISTACHVERIVRGWRRVDSYAEARETAHRHKSRALHVYQDQDGMWIVRGRLTPEVGAALVQALHAGREALYQQRRTLNVDSTREAGYIPQDVSAETPSMEINRPTRWPSSQRRLSITASIPGRRASDTRWSFTSMLPFWPILISLAESALDDGTHVSAETSRRLACDASRVVMQHARDGRVVEVAARTRTIPPALRRALQHRDYGCRFPGYEVRFGQGHHIRHWAQGGPTTLSNLALLCRRHHRSVHEEGYQVERQTRLKGFICTGGATAVSSR